MAGFIFCTSNILCKINVSAEIIVFRLYIIKIYLLSLTNGAYIRLWKSACSLHRLTWI